MTIMFVVGVVFGVIASAIFAEWVKAVEHRTPKIPNFPNPIPPPPAAFGTSPSWTIIRRPGKSGKCIQGEAISKLTLVTFADKNMSRAADLCVSSAYQHGVTSHYLYTPEILQSREIVKANPQLFRQPEDPRRAWAWWAFKPVIIAEAMEGMADGEICLYSDVGVAFIDNLNYVVDRMDQDIWLYGNEWPHYMWCKRDIIEAIWPERRANFNNFAGESGSNRNLWASFGNQAQASVIFFRVNDHTRAFVAEWLKWCLAGYTDPFSGSDDVRYLIDDSPSFNANHPEFRENRHDQAILTTLAYREGIKLHPWNVQYLTFEPARREGYPEDAQIPVLYLHHRLRDDCWHEYESRTMR